MASQKFELIEFALQFAVTPNTLVDSGPRCSTIELSKRLNRHVSGTSESQNL